MEALRESEARYSRLVEQALDGVAIVQDGIFRFVNPACAVLLGCRREEIVGTPLVDIMAPEYRDLVADRYRRRMAGEAVSSYYGARLLRRDGATRDAEFSISMISHDGRPATMAIIRDVTERRRAEEALRRERDRNREYLAVAGVIMIALDREGTVTLINRRGCEVLGCPEDEIVGANWFDTFLPARLRESVRDILEELLDGKAEEREWHENPVLTKRGDERLIWWRNVILKDEEGRIVGILSSGEDITERKQAEDALRESEQKYKALVEGTPQGILVVRDLRIVFANGAAAEILRRSVDELAALPPVEVNALFPPTDWPESARRHADPQAGRPVPQHTAYRLSHPDGSESWIDAYFNAVQFAGRPAVQIAFADITRRKAAEAELHRMEAQLAHVGRLTAMGELVAGIAHEVSQPLYAIVNFAKAVRNVLAAGNQPGYDDLRVWNEEILMAATRAADVLQRQRDFARKTETHRSPAAVDEIIAEAVRLVDGEARRHRIAVRLDSAPAPVLVCADRVQIQQVLVNLLRNAFESLRHEASKARQVTIHTGATEENVQVSVADNGPGLPPDKGQSIFEPFVSTRPEGLGIGLAISKTIVGAHGGALWAEPVPEGGAVFHFTLPTIRGDRADEE